MKNKAVIDGRDQTIRIDSAQSEVGGGEQQVTYRLTVTEPDLAHCAGTREQAAATEGPSRLRRDDSGGIGVMPSAYFDWKEPQPLVTRAKYRNGIKMRWRADRAYGDERMEEMRMEAGQK
ncbi:MAG: hypothetical protein MMC23_002801 [Stictis urceolatum]|nr:hypothetical protein [Stictis urceolata]